MLWPGSHHYEGVYVKSPADALRNFHRLWVEGGRQADYDPAQSLRQPVRRPFKYFTYTNTVRFEGEVHTCRFGHRLPRLSSGVLAITEEGVVVWVSSATGKVTVSPDVNGIDPD
jgi:hypothetical protein